MEEWVGRTIGSAKIHGVGYCSCAGEPLIRDTKGGKKDSPSNIRASNILKSL